MSELNKSIRYIKGIGEQRAKSLSKLGVYTLRDLVSFFPRAYEDRSVAKTLSEVMDGEEALISAYVITPPRLHRVRKGMDLVKFRIADNSGACDVTFFNQSYVKDSIKQGFTYYFMAGLRKHVDSVDETLL
jgi:ATP-dependent DNA helicase RecG